MSDEITETKKERYKLYVYIDNEQFVYKRYAMSEHEAKSILTDFLKTYYDTNFNIFNIEKDKTHTC